MNELRKTADRLRNMADEIDGIAKQMALPVQQVDIPEAFAKLRAALGNDVHIAVKPPHFDSYSVGNDLKVGPWTVYLGSDAGKGHDNHEGVTLADAVNAALKACAPETEGNVQVEIANVTEAFAEPLPM